MPVRKHRGRLATGIGHWLNSSPSVAHAVEPPLMTHPPPPYSKAEGFRPTNSSNSRSEIQAELGKVR
jgi:hypothetical protein